MQPPYDKEFKQLSESFKTELLALGHSKKGAESKYRFIVEFLHQMELKGRTQISKISTKEIEQYYQYLQNRPNKTTGGILSEKSIYQHITAIGKLFEMLLERGEIKVNPNTLKLPYPNQKTERIILSQKEIKQLYAATKSFRERAILSLAYGCGLRAMELELLNTQDIKTKQGILIVQKGKGNKRRVVPISEGVKKDLENYYFKEREELAKARNYIQGEKAFMLNLIGSRMRKWTYNYTLVQILERSTINKEKAKKIQIHNLRHSIATHLLEQGVKLEQVRKFLGHSQLETTEIYTRINQKQIKSLYYGTQQLSKKKL